MHHNVSVFNQPPSFFALPRVFIFLAFPHSSLSSPLSLSFTPTLSSPYHPNTLPPSLLPSLPQAVTLFGLWAIPCYGCVKMFFWRMLSVWFLFSVTTLYVMFKATRRKLNTGTPR